MIFYKIMSVCSIIVEKWSLPIWPFNFCGNTILKRLSSYLAITITKKLSLSSHLFIMPEKEGYILCSWFLMGLHWSIIVKAFENVILMVLVLLKCAEILALLCAWVQEFYTYLSIRNFLGPQPSGLTCVYPPG